MQDKSYAIIALKEILTKALDAVAARAVTLACPHTGTSLDAGKMTVWDLEFAEMSRDEQAAWLIHLFETLIENG